MYAASLHYSAALLFVGRLFNFFRTDTLTLEVVTFVDPGMEEAQRGRCLQTALSQPDSTGDYIQD